MAAKREKMEGSIEVGKLADVIIISQDLFRISPNQISETKVLMTMVGKLFVRLLRGEVNNLFCNRIPISMIRT